MGLGKLILMSAGEAESGGRTKKTILADACEAVLGAVFIDGGYGAARKLVETFWALELEGVEPSIPDAKSALQEWAQSRRLPLPRYVEVAREGPITLPASRPRCRSTASSQSGDMGRTSGPRSRRRHSPCSCARGFGRPRKMAEPADKQAQAGQVSRCGFVALIGAPNSGKSTLINALVGAKVAIVTHKAQTTRGPVLGIALSGASQIILVDTPGIFRPKRRLDRAMSAAAWNRAAEADLVALVIDAERGLDTALDPIFAELPMLTRPVIAVLNKIDLVPRPELLLLASEFSKRHAFERVFMISALTGDGVADLKTHLMRRRAARALALSRGSAHRCAAPPGCRGDHPREAVLAAA